MPSIMPRHSSDTVFRHPALHLVTDAHEEAVDAKLLPPNNQLSKDDRKLGIDSRIRDPVPTGRTIAGWNKAGKQSVILRRNAASRQSGAKMFLSPLSRIFLGFRSLLRQRGWRADDKLVAVDVQRRGGLHLDGVVACSQHSNGTMWASSSTHHKACLTTVMYSCSAHP